MNTFIDTPNVERDVLGMSFTAAEVVELRTVLNRAMNTWEPNQHPTWLQPLSDKVDTVMGVTVVTPKVTP